MRTRLLPTLLLLAGLASAAPDPQAVFEHPPQSA